MDKPKKSSISTYASISAPLKREVKFSMASDAEYEQREVTKL